MCVCVSRYIYQLYMVHEHGNWGGEGTVSVNHGVEARVLQNGMNEARIVWNKRPQGGLKY